MSHALASHDLTLAKISNSDFSPVHGYLILWSFIRKSVGYVRLGKVMDDVILRKSILKQTSIIVHKSTISHVLKASYHLDWASL